MQHNVTRKYQWALQHDLGGIRGRDDGLEVGDDLVLRPSSAQSTQASETVQNCFASAANGLCSGG